MRKKLLLAFMLMLDVFYISAQSFSVDGFSYVPITGTTVRLTASAKQDGDIVIPETVANGDKSYKVTAIGDGVFLNSSITSAELPSSVTYIGNEAFRLCMDLTRIKMSENVDTIGTNAFTSCLKLKDMEWPRRLKYVGNGAFIYAESLTCEIYLPAKVTLEDEAFMGMGGIPTLTFDGTPEYVGAGALSGMMSLTTLNMNKMTPASFSPEDVFSDGWDEADGSSITLYVPTGAKGNYEKDSKWGNFFRAIEEKKFENTDPSDPGETGERVDSMVENYTSPDGRVVSVHVATAGTFTKLVPAEIRAKVQKLTVSGKLNGTDWAAIRIMAGGDISGDEVKETKLDTLDIHLADIVEGGDPYFKTSTEWYYTENDVIGANFITGCHSLKKFVLPKYAESVGNDGLAYASSLKTVVFGKRMKSLGTTCFYECKSLESIDIPDQVERFSDMVFYACANLKHVKLPASLRTLPTATFYYCTALTDVQMPSSLTTIGDMAFFNCAALPGIYIPKGVTYVSPSAFNQCSSLKSFTVDGENSAYTSIDGVLFNSSATTLLSYPLGNEAEEYVLPETVENIQDNAFWTAKVGKVVLNDGLKTIGKGAFSECANLKEVVWGKGLETIDKDAFSSASSLRSAELPESVSEIGSGAFAYNVSLEDLKLPSQLKVISESSFTGCTSLKSVHIPAAVESIEALAFANCTGLDSVIVESMTPPVCAYDEAGESYGTPFYEVNIADCVLKVPAGTEDAYRAAAVWSGFGKISTGINKVEGNANSEIIERYSIDGVRLPISQRRGISIIKMKDGTTKKVMIP